MGVNSVLSYPQVGGTTMLLPADAFQRVTLVCLVKVLIRLLFYEKCPFAPYSIIGITCSVCLSICLRHLRRQNIF